MTRLGCWTVSLVLMATSALSAQQSVPTPGSRTTFVSTVSREVAGNKVTLDLTGTALRKKLVFNVYAVGSYVERGSEARTAESLAAADVPKMLHLVMERNVDGGTMSENVVSMILANHARTEFPEDLRAFEQFLRDNSVAAGDNVYITHVPGKGFTCEIVGRAELVVENLKLANAVWEIYLGRRNLGQNIKDGLTNRLR